MMRALGLGRLAWAALAALAALLALLWLMNTRDESPSDQRISSQAPAAPDSPGLLARGESDAAMAALRAALDYWEAHAPDVEPATVIERVPPADRLFFLQKPFHPHEVSTMAVTPSTKPRRPSRRTAGKRVPVILAVTIRSPFQLAGQVRPASARVPEPAGRCPAAARAERSRPSCRRRVSCH